MKFLTTVTTLFLTVGCLYAQVSNVRVQQRTDGTFITDIWYNLAYSGENMLAILVEASADNGATWDLMCTHLTGDVGGNITPGTDKHIVWDFYADNPNVSGNQYKVRLTARDDYMMGNDGKLYKTVIIGNQVWMAENLKETLYRNGDPIPVEKNNYNWYGLSTGARCSYNNSDSLGNVYGYLYNWFVVDDARQIAPEGWHVPSKGEWNALKNYLFNDACSKLKEQGTMHWNSYNVNATNSSGFTALGAGDRFVRLDAPLSGYFRNLENASSLWASTSSRSFFADIMLLASAATYVIFDEEYRECGCSLRLIKD